MQSFRIRAEQTRPVVVVLGLAQTIAFASTYYLPAILANAIAKDLGTSPVMVFAALSTALIISALVGPWCGRHIDQNGGRGLLMASNGLFVMGLVVLSLANGPVMLFAAWIIIGTGMGIGLYEAAFASLAALYGRSARSVITGITLIAGFASTIGWPVSALLEAHYGWRIACLFWAGVHVFVAFPLNWLLPDKNDAVAPEAESVKVETTAADAANAPSRMLIVLLAVVFAIGWFNSTSMASHLPRLLEACGATTAVAVAAGSLIGPAQVAARIFEYSVMQKYHPLITARLAVLGHPIGAAILMLIGGPAAYAFTLVHGAGNGVMTIMKGTLPLALIGPRNYGYWQGIISMPGRILQAFSPLLFGFAIEAFGGHAIWITSGLSLIAFTALVMIRK